MLVLFLIIFLIVSLAINLFLIVKIVHNKEFQLAKEGVNKHLKRRLDELSIFNQKILDNVPVSIAVINQEGDVILTNAYFNKIVPWYDPQKGLNLLKSKRIQAAGLVNKYENVLKQGITFTQKGVLLKAPKPYYSYYLNFEVLPLKNEKEEIIGAISIGQEITPLIKAKDRLEKVNQQLNEEVKKRTEEFYQINNQLAEKIDFYEKIFDLLTENIKKNLAFLKKDQTLITAEEQKDQEKVSLIFKDFVFLNQINKNDLHLNIEKIGLANYLANLFYQFNPRIDFDNQANSEDVMLDKDKFEYILKGFYEHFKEYIETGKAVLNKKGNQLSLSLDFFLKTADFTANREQDNFFWDIRLLLFKEIINLHKGILTEKIEDNHISFNIRLLISQ